MILGGDLKKGTTLRLDGTLWRVTGTEYQKPGRGTASMRTTMMNIATGSTNTKIFGAEERLENIYVENEESEFLYRDGDILHFMNTQTYDQYEVPAALFGDDGLYLKDGMKLELRLFENVCIDYQLPTTVTYKIVDSEVAVVGDTAGAVMKRVTTETGLSVQVPIFIGVGEMIKIDTRDGSYLGRDNS